MSNTLLMGCGHSKAIHLPSVGVDYSTPTTLDIDPFVKPDVLWDLNQLPYPFGCNEFDEIHAYEVLEHCGVQGDWRFFFAQFNEFWRMLKPGGKFIFSVPHPHSQWVWGDPGHTRIVHPNNLVFLSKSRTDGQLGVTSMTNYSSVWFGDFDIEYGDIVNESFICKLRAIK